MLDIEFTFTETLGRKALFVNREELAILKPKTNIRQMGYESKGWDGGWDV